MNPITSATVSGIGQTPLGVVEGTWVVGFFTDSDGQQPMIMGTLPGVPSTLPTKDSNIGFQDVGNANYPKYTETDVNRLAVGNDDNPHSSLTIRKADRDLAVGVTQIDGIFDGVAQIPTDLDITSWDEPETPYDAAYPRNHVYESEGGHIREMDDTPGKERIHERHSSGSGYEIHPNGTKVTRIKNDNYEITSNDEYLHIQGIARHTVDKGMRIRVNAEGTSGNNYNVEVGQGSNVNIEVNGGNINLTTLGSGQDAGDININASRNLNIQVGNQMNVNVIRNSIENVGGKKDEFVIGNNTKTGKKIDLN
tara:strand:- start:193 stop:1119 length:927 start_codon:yes stop_codon:yes gene_type:complete